MTSANLSSLLVAWTRNHRSRVNGRVNLILSGPFP
jgi:hypothetical protein